MIIHLFSTKELKADQTKKETDYDGNTSFPAGIFRQGAVYKR